MAPYLRLRQVALVAPHREACSQLLQALLGLEECHRDPAVEAYGLDNIVMPLGPDRFLEVVSPRQPGTAAGRFLERSGGLGGYMLIFDCDDPDARVARAEAMGVRLAHRMDRPDFVGRQLHPRDCRAVFLEFDHSKGGEALSAAYWPAGPHWQDHVRLETVETLEAAEILSADPEGLAAHWAALMDLPATQTPQGPAIEVEAQRLLFREAPGLARERLDALVLRVRDAAGILARARCLGLETDETGFRLCGVWMRLRESGA